MVVAGRDRHEPILQGVKEGQGGKRGKSCEVTELRSACALSEASGPQGYRAAECLRSEDMEVWRGNGSGRSRPA